MVRLGFALPQYGAQARAAGGLARFAAEVEDAGAQSLWVGDRLLAAVRPTVGYGGGDTIPPEFDWVLDPFAVLTLAAGATRRVRLGTNVLIAPLYQPALLARSLTALDVLSDGRLLPGFGIGWSPEEYRAAGVEFARRGARLEEMLDALEALWTTDPAQYHGRFYDVPAHRAARKPAQRPRPPVGLAGFGQPSLERVGRRGDYWLPVMRVPGADGWAGHIRRARRIVDRAAEAAGRDPAGIGDIVRVNVAAGTSLPRVADSLLRACDESGIEEMFVDLLSVADSIAAAGDAARQLLERVR